MVSVLTRRRDTRDAEEEEEWIYVPEKHNDYVSKKLNYKSVRGMFSGALIKAIRVSVTHKSGRRRKFLIPTLWILFDIVIN